MSDGGYDEGYSRCPNFWGEDPAAMVKRVVEEAKTRGYSNGIDLGCGDGKNSAAMARVGLSVLAVDRSEIAIANAMARFPDLKVTWLVCNLLSIEGPTEGFDVVLATGSLHCLTSEEEIVRALHLIKRLTRPGGLNAISAFDDGPQDMSGHVATFKPTFARHARYVQAYDGWEIVESSSQVQTDVHPHNNKEHSHSITRVLARKPRA
jgi:2-polyprenyl-3-methyl-5-hydroxy-6-metoxy-1,4-benzoquinol methylase